MARPLTARQQQVYDYIHQKISLRGYGPTVREIGDFLGIKSPNGVMCHLRALERKGMINRSANKSRAIELTSQPPRDKTAGLTVRGQVEKGECCLFDAPKSIDVMGMLEHPQRYLLQYSGHDLRDFAIADGDILVVETSSHPNLGALELIRNELGVIELKPSPESATVGSRPASTNSLSEFLTENPIADESVDGHADDGHSRNADSDNLPALEQTPVSQVVGVVVGILRTHQAANHHLTSPTGASRPRLTSTST
ncbi:MAG: repressor LexA [Pirellulaceae bacterium]|nr:repressor LexA [Pirellulaceae bacterium]